MYKSMQKFLAVVVLVSLFGFTVVQPVSAQNVAQNITKEEQITTTEAYVIERFSEVRNEIGIFEVEGFDVVSAITTITTKNNLPMRASIQSITDYYDLDWNYLKTVSLNSDSENIYNTGKSKTRESTRLSASPINTEDAFNNYINNLEFDGFELLDLSNEVEQIISNKIVSETKTLPNTTYTESEGMTLEQLDEIKQEIMKNLDNNQVLNQLIQPALVPTSYCPTSGTPGVEACGAYDNYYRHNVVNGDFTVQALCCVGDPQKYVRLNGSISGNYAKASRLITFKTEINAYERHLVEDLNSNAYSTEVGTWTAALSSFVTLLAGFSTGPWGWFQIATHATNAVLVFAGFTSAIYATAARTNISKNTALRQDNAMQILYSMYWNADGNYAQTIVTGY